jgi:phosphoglycerol transferase
MASQAIDCKKIYRQFSIYLGIGIVGSMFVLLVLRNTGLFPVVFADEQFYSYFSRLAPMEASPRPSYLYFILYSFTNSCGAGYLECARIINSLLMVSALPFIYLIARRIATRGVAIWVTGISTLDPINTYTAYFMPEAMYFFGFWGFLWIALKGRDRSWLVYSVAVGASLALLSLIKAHAVFLLAAVGLFEVLFRRKEGWKVAIRNAFRVLLGSAVVFLAVRLGLGYVLAGAKGLSILGSDYSSIGLSTKGEMATYLLLLFRGSVTSLAGHGLGLILLFLVPLAIIVQRLFTGRSAGEVAERSHEITFLTIGVMLTLLVVTAAFTAKVVDLGPYESISRIHARYYNFMFPLFLITAASGLRTYEAEAVSKWRMAGIAIGVALILAAYPILAKYYSLSFVDSPELRGVTVRPMIGWSVAIIGALCLAVWAWSSKLGSAVYLFVFVPAILSVGTVVTSMELRARMVPDSVDHAGKFARMVLGDGVSKLVVAGAEPASLYRAQFYADHPGTTQLLLKPGERLNFCHIPADRDWLLLLGNHDTDFDRRRQIATQDYSLISLKSAIDVEFSKPAWPLQLRTSGLALAESWGRWSIDERVILQFDFPLPAKLRITFVANAFGPNVSEPFVVRIGQQEKIFRLDASPQTVAFEFETNGYERVVEIVVPRPTSPSEIGLSADSRRLGIGLIRLNVKETESGATPQCESSGVPKA